MPVARPQTRKAVTYLHHTRDRDGDVIFYFLDPERPTGNQVMQSSPVLGLSRCLSAVLDPEGRGNVGKYIITTQNTCYEVQMPRDKAEHLLREVGVPKPSLR
jgi:hypothetical protein